MATTTKTKGKKRSAPTRKVPTITQLAKGVDGKIPGRNTFNDLEHNLLRDLADLIFANHPDASLAKLQECLDSEFECILEGMENAIDEYGEECPLADLR